MEPARHLNPEQIKEIIDFIEMKAWNYVWHMDDVPELVISIFEYGVSAISNVVCGQTLSEMNKAARKHWNDVNNEQLRSAVDVPITKPVSTC